MKIDLERLLQPLSSFNTYWVNYGGIKALLYSLYLWLSIILALLVSCINYFFYRLDMWDWTEGVYAVVPSILGFSLGGYAILVGFGGEKFLKILMEKDSDDEISTYMSANASFLHFIFVQFICIVYTSIAKALQINSIIMIYFFGVLIFFYSLFTIIATAFAILNLSDLSEKIINITNNSNTIRRHD